MTEKTAAQLIEQIRRLVKHHNVGYMTRLLGLLDDLARKVEELERQIAQAGK